MKQTQIDDKVKAVCAAWDAQPSAQSLILEAKRKAAGLKTLKQMCEEAGVSYDKAKRWVYWTSH